MYAAGTWGWRTFSFLAVFRLLPISPSKNIIAQSSPSLAASYGARHAASLRLFGWATRDHADRAINCAFIVSLFFEQVFPQENVISRPIASTSLSNYTRRKYPMLPELPATSTATKHFHSLVDRVLHLRRQLGIDIALSLRDTEDIHLSPRGFQESSREMPKHASPTTTVEIG